MSITIDHAHAVGQEAEQRWWRFTTWTPRRASLVSGWALAAMAMLAAAANFGAITPLIIAGNASATATAMSANTAQFLFGIIGLLIVVALDVVVAGAWYTLFAPVNQTLSGIAAWSRVVFAAGFTLAISQLIVALVTTNTAGASLVAANLFTTIWVSVLGIFGLHLLVVGYLAFRSGFVARIFGILLAIGGAGYLADAVGILAVPGFTAVFASYLFFGEVAMIFWLLIRGRALPARAHSRTLG